MKNNQEIIAERIKARKSLEGIRTGDVLIRRDGRKSRITHVWTDHVQDGGNNGSFFMYHSGRASYSGGLDYGVQLKDVVPTNEIEEHEFWIFSEDRPGPGRRYNFIVPVQVWKEI